MIFDFGLTFADLASLMNTSSSTSSLASSSMDESRMAILLEGTYGRSLIILGRDSAVAVAPPSCACKKASDLAARRMGCGYLKASCGSCFFVQLQLQRCASGECVKINSDVTVSRSAVRESGACALLA